MCEIVINWVGKLQELGQKCRFVPLIDVGEASNFTVGAPSFKCTIYIKEYAIHVEEAAQNKKMAKTAAAKIAYEKICEKINAPQTSSTDKIALLLKDLNVKDNEMTVAAKFFKAITTLKLDSSARDISYASLKELLNDLNCSLNYSHDEYKQENGTEFRFKCEVRPDGHDYPVITGFGWSTSSPEDAKDKGVKQLLSSLEVYSNHK